MLAFPEDVVAPTSLEHLLGHISELDEGRSEAQSSLADSPTG